MDPKCSFTLSAVWGHNENMAIYEPGNRLSPDPKFASALLFEFPVSKTMRNSLLFLSHSIYDISVIAAQID